MMALASCQTSKDIIPSATKEGIYNKEMTKDLQDGAVDLFKQTVKMGAPNKNIVISPLSIQYAFGMAASGAKGETQDQILKILGGSPGHLKDINSNLMSIQTKIASQDKDYYLTVSNGLFYDDTKFDMSGSYSKAVKDMYQAKIKKLDFKNVNESVKTINDWVAENTQQRISKVIDNIQSEEFMFLINALYMKASWDQPFEPTLTQNSKFTTSNKVEKEVPMMRQRANIAYLSNDDVKAIVMPMGGGKLEALFVMPLRTDVYNYTSAITSSGLDKMYAEAQVRDIEIGLPKVEMKQHYDLKDILSKMGVTLPFSKRADFTAMGTATGNILLTRALHDVFMKMDEKGMEGAGVTTIGVGTTSMPEYVGFDHPYLMIVRDKATGTYLFMGKVEDPTK